MWRDAVEQLAGYMRLGATILYGAVVIGTYIRLYYLEPGEPDIEGLPDQRNRKAIRVPKRRGGNRQNSKRVCRDNQS
jgi:hypothetical protein